MERRDRFLPPYISTRFTARLLTILLLFTAAVSGLSAGFEISQLHLLSGVGDYADVDEETRWAHTFIRNTLLVSRLLLYGSIGIACITWLHRCRINARAFGCRRFRYSRIWAIIGFFVPIVNFFRPYQVVSEVWRASDPRSVETSVAWINMPVSRFVLAWWVVLLVSAFLEILAAGLLTHSGATIDDLFAARSIGVLVGATSAASAILAYLVISGIEESQQEKWAIISRAEAEADANDPYRIDHLIEPEPPAITARSIWRAHTADS
ncbi:MAG: DUF4328 domain-containing protein [Deltaproteobacteria bacterium]|jgi:hypothetical protein|nr:DUF4328 domain-containing protein [Deltaproteobacteria bacterium]